MVWGICRNSTCKPLDILSIRLRLQFADAYVDGPGIIMELIQNADDAGASEVGLMLDMHNYPAESIVGKPLGSNLFIPHFL